MPVKKNITIYDIAREAHVSPATVSRILTGNTTVSKAKRDAVTALIDKYSFRPNAMARALTETHSHIIGMISADANNPYYNSVFTACENEAHRRGYVLMLFNTCSRPEQEEAALLKLREQRVDAIILCGGRVDLIENDPDFMRLLDNALESTPIIVGSRSPHKRVYGVGVDHERSMDLALEYLISLGHTDIGFMYTGKQFYGTQAYLTRFYRTMQRSGLRIRDEWMISVDGYDCMSGREGIKKLMRCRQLPTALLGINDMVTAGALQGLSAYGMRVPEDISLMGFDDTYITTITSPELTAVDFDYAHYGRELLDAAMCAIDGTRSPYTHLIAPSLSIKKSCAPLKRRELRGMI